MKTFSKISVMIALVSFMGASALAAPPSTGQQDKPTQCVASATATTSGFDPVTGLPSDTKATSGSAAQK